MERIAKLKNLSSKRVAFIYGQNTQDRFLTNDYREIDFEDALFEMLHVQGFERIVFFGYDRRIYFKDDRSRELTAPQGVQQSTRQSSPTSGLKSPLGTKRGGPSDPSSTQNQALMTGYSRIDDPSAIILLDRLIRDSSIQTAIVITQAEQTLDLLNRATEIRLGRWTTLPSTNRNVCVMVFSCENLKDEIEKDSRTLPVEEFCNFVRNSAGIELEENCFKVPSPEEQEVNRMLNYARLMFTKPVEWKNIKKVRTLVANDGKPLQDWLLKFRGNSFSEISVGQIAPLLSSARPNSTQTWEETLDSMVGMETIKQTIHSRAKFFENSIGKNTNKPPFLHMAFLGNPGTGKTTVAELMGEVYRDIGALRRGHVVSKTPADFVKGSEDATIRQTIEYVHEALDGVLFIDEAYQLADNDSFGTGQKVIDTLVPLMVKYADRFALVVAGYERQMKNFLENKKQSGMSRRIPQRNRIIFKDLGPDELYEVFTRSLKRDGLVFTSSFEEQMRKIIKGLYKTRDPLTFGNAGVMETLAVDIIEKYRGTVGTNRTKPDETLTVEHIPENYKCFLPPKDPREGKLMEELNKLIGLNAVKKDIAKLRNDLLAKKAREELGQPVEDKPLNVVFKGNTGTGKTTVARLYAKMLRQLGLITQEKTKVVRPDNLIAGYVGQTHDKAMAQFMDSVDGVLMIDEVHNLAVEEKGTSFNREAISALMEFMDNFRDRVVIIIAGYPEGVDNFLRSDPGLGPRFTTEIKFEDYTSDELVEIFKVLCEDYKILLPSIMLPQIKVFFDQIRYLQGAGFQNARNATTLFNRLRDCQNERYVKAFDVQELTTFLPEDLSSIKSELIGDEVINYKHYDLVSHLPADTTLPDFSAVTDAVGLIRVESSKDASQRGTGSGFIVAPQGLLMTAYHVVESCDKFKFRLNGTETELEATLLGYDKDNDLAILSLPITRLYPFLPLITKDEQIQLLTEIQTFGYPLGEQFGQEITITDGVVSSIRENNRLLQITSPVTHGNSGGPVVRKADRKVIGVLCSGAKDTRAQMNFASNINLIHELFGINPKEN